MSEQTTLAISQSPHLMPALTVGQAAQRYKSTVAFVRDMMKAGTDYDTIPGTAKETLLKPGAEKLTTFFGLTPQFPVVEKVEDWMGTDHGGEPFFYYWYKCQLWRSDLLVAEADGSCNSMESKYRWRWVNETDLPPGTAKTSLKIRAGSQVEFTFAVDKAETTGKYGKPPEYWQSFQEAIDNGSAKRIKRKTRAGKEYDAWQIDATVYRIPNEDIFSQVNTIKKMAQKRALVAATLLAVNASEFFTQDLEDMDLGTFVDAAYTVHKGNDGDGNGGGVTWDAATTQAGEEEAAPLPRAEAPTNGGKRKTEKERLDQLLIDANNATVGHYNHTVHLFKTMKLERGDEFAWPRADDDDGWADCLAVLVAHAEKQAA